MKIRPAYIFRSPHIIVFIVACILVLAANALCVLSHSGIDLVSFSGCHPTEAMRWHWFFPFEGLLGLQIALVLSVCGCALWGRSVSMAYALIGIVILVQVTLEQFYLMCGSIYQTGAFLFLVFAVRCMHLLSKCSSKNVRPACACFLISMVALHLVWAQLYLRSITGPINNSEELAFVHAQFIKRVIWSAFWFLMLAVLFFSKRLEAVAYELNNKASHAGSR